MAKLGAEMEKKELDDLLTDWNNLDKETKERFVTGIHRGFIPSGPPNVLGAYAKLLIYLAERKEIPAEKVGGGSGTGYCPKSRFAPNY